VQSAAVLEFPAPGALTIDQVQGGALFADGLPSIPVLPETFLAIELLVQNHWVDLNEIAQLVLSDMGATLQVFRLMAEESGDRCQRIEDCISSLGPRACLEAIEQGFQQGGLLDRSMSAVWRHAREIAEHARLVAEAGDSPMTPDEAYLAGLLHPLGILPSLLAWDEPDLALDQALVGLRLSARWALPESVRNLFCSAFIPGQDPYRLQLIRDAHRLSGSSSPWCTVASGFTA
jgi:HD-like signal output (HDOD) protein